MSAAAASRLLYGANVRANGIRQHYLRFGGAGPIVVIVPDSGERYLTTALYVDEEPAPAN